MSIIVTVDRNWAISREHKPLISIPDDVKFVRDTTYGQVIVMGRHTFEHAFSKKALPNRTTIVVTKEEGYAVPGAVIVHSTEEALKAAESEKKDIYVLGGKRLYEELLDRCDEVHVTSVDYAYAADSWFPNLDKKPEWVMVDISEEQTHFDVVYYFKRYMRRKDLIYF
ncbi:MAG: dihydrofolate reductase [Parasporobacterium sp.]|nr:dihydrofolate reductase [Parasporobacterium sp.]